MKYCEFLNVSENARFPNECKSRYFCLHHRYGRNDQGYSFKECSREGDEFVPEETFTFGIGYFVES